MLIEKRIIRLIKSLDRIMNTWDTLSLRRTIVNIFSIMIFTQIIITTIYWMFGKDISTTWVGIIGIEFGAWGTILAYYFNIRGKADVKNIRESIREDEEREGADEK